MLRTHVLTLAAAAVLASAACSRPTPPEPSASAEQPGVSPATLQTSADATPALDSETRVLTGAHTRVVWVQHDGSDPFAQGTNLTVRGYDSDDGRGERAIVAPPGNYAKPLFTSDGQRIVYSTVREGDDGEVFIVNFDGSGARSLGAGFGLHVRPASDGGADWLYIGTAHRDFHYGVVSRARLDAPDQRETVWDKTRVNRDTFQVSVDGRVAGGLYPWPEAGVADLQAGTVQRLGDGCWTAICQVGPPLFWYFDGAHRNLTMVDVPAGRRWLVPINTAPGFSNPEVYHPRWANHARFIALSGPYDQGGGNQVRSGGTQVEIHLGRFSADFTRIEAWARVTRNDRADAYPDVWVAPTQSPHPLRASRTGPAGDGSGEGPAPAGTVAPDRVVIEARLTHAGPIPSPESILPYRNALAVNRYEVVSVKAGTYDKREVLVSQWIIRDSQVLAQARRQPGLQAVLTLERHDAHPELEGERVISDTDAPELALYHDIES